MVGPEHSSAYPIQQVDRFADNTYKTFPREQDTDELVDYLHAATRQVWIVCPLILLVLGTLGNGLSIVVLSRKAMRRSTVSIYLTVLSVVDMFALYTGLLRQWLRFYFLIDVRHIGQAFCKVSCKFRAEKKKKKGLSHVIQKGESRVYY